MRTPALGEPFEVEIETLGRQGDGQASHAGVPVYVRLALPGDRLTVQPIARRGEGFAATVIAEHRLAARADPACRHFGRCGGCQLQHLPEPAYRAWHGKQIDRALAQRGIQAVPIRPLVPTEPGSRRRVRLAFAGQDRVDVGFRERQAHRVVNLEVCPVADPGIVDLLAPIRQLLSELTCTDGRGELQVTRSDTGLDLLLQSKGPLQLADREALAAFAAIHDVARLAWHRDSSGMPEPVAARRPVQVHFGDIAVDLPAGAFLQATAGAEGAIRLAVREAIGAAVKIADLYAGCGAFALPIAVEGGRLLAVERDLAMTSALAAAARRAGLAGRLVTAARDLDRQPLAGPELDALDAVILDPPRGGARSQAAALAESSVPRIAMVSCNPQTFSRDARILIDGGYALSWIQPIDAFLWSSQIELVGAFTRNAP